MPFIFTVVETSSLTIAVAYKLLAVGGVAKTWKVSTQLTSSISIQSLGYLISFWLLCARTSLKGVQAPLFKSD